ncbi:MAG: hypothetical protein IT226_00965 [Flavobacteriales bacterium]|nr:hypothetical protein [Flavobacteriales bacterium]
MRERIVLIGREGSATAILYHALVVEFDVYVLHETPPPVSQLLRWRAKHGGWWKVCGQVLFRILVAKPLGWMSTVRRAAILKEHGVSDQEIASVAVTRIGSVNSPECWDRVHALSPRAVVINGTRILSKKTIAALGVPVLNTHVGITPMYRGVHGAYWALVNDDRAHCGVTVHLVDEGIDTGGILHQALIEPTDQDNFSTYPVMQMAVGAKLMVRAVSDLITGIAAVKHIEGESRRWYHPTLWQYLRNRTKRGIR